jgi:hypothetical protein
MTFTNRGRLVIYSPDSFSTVKKMYIIYDDDNNNNNNNNNTSMQYAARTSIKKEVAALQQRVVSVRPINGTLITCAAAAGN